MSYGSNSGNERDNYSQEINNTKSSSRSTDSLSCRNDCGFYGSPQFYGYCSQCHALFRTNNPDVLPTNSGIPGEMMARSNEDVQNDYGLEIRVNDDAAAAEFDANQSNVAQNQMDFAGSLANDDITSQVDDFTDFGSNNMVSTKKQFSFDNDAREISVAHNEISSTVDESQIISNKNQENALETTCTISKADKLSDAQLLRNGDNNNNNDIKNDNNSSIHHDYNCIEEKQEKLLDDNQKSSEKKTVKQIDRSKCATCSKKLKITDFECRCGLMLCRSHRMSQKHNCSFDFVALQREEIKNKYVSVKPKNIKEF